MAARKPAAKATQETKTETIEGVEVNDPKAGTGQVVNAETGEVTEPGEPLPEIPTPQVDRVAAVSYRADGTPDQTEGFVVLLED